MSTVITSIARTPIGRLGGVFKTVTAVDLGAAAIRGALDRSGLSPEKIDEVLFGEKPNYSGWKQAQEAHQRLYTDNITDLQRPNQ